MAIAGGTAPALRIRWHNRGTRTIAITHSENRPAETLEATENGAIAALEVRGYAWIRATDAPRLREQGYTVKPVELLRLTPAGG